MMNSDSRDLLMSSRWMNNLLLPYDDRGTVRTGKEWFDRYMVFPWEKGNEFTKVAGETGDR